MRRAVIIGGTGMIGRAVARRLLDHGWRVDLLGRDPDHVPGDLRRRGVGFTAGDRADPAVVRGVLRPGADLLVDCACYTAAHARTLAPVLDDVASLVMISSKAVYVDEHGNHANSAMPPVFPAPIRETQPTLAADGSDQYASRDGYGACKVAAENVLLDTGRPVTVLRPSKVHGQGALQPYEWAFVKRVLDRRAILPLAHHGRSGDHPSAAVNIAALVQAVADHPGRRVLNAADPDTPTGLQIAHIVATHLHHHWTEVLLDDDADPTLGRHPWNRWPPVWLDTTAATLLGYQPVGDYQATVAGTLDWLVDIAQPTVTGASLPSRYDNAYFDRMLDYPAEDARCSVP